MTDIERGPENAAGMPEGLSRAEFEAIEWQVRLSSGEATDADRAAYAAWRLREPAHALAATGIGGLWDGLGPAFAVRARRRRVRMRAALAVAASLLLTLFGVEAWRLHGAAPIAMDVADAGGSCRLSLGGGEAYFDVTPNPRRAAGGRETQVRMLGAAFSIRPESSGVLVTVLGGQVAVNAGSAARIVAAGQQLRCRAAGHDASIEAGSVASTAPRNAPKIS